MSERRAPYKASSLESSLLWQMRAAGLPEPMREYRFAAGRQLRADFAWPAYRLLVEVEGGTYINGGHTRGQGYAHDCRKYNLAALLGWTVLRYTTEMVRSGEAIRGLEEYIICVRDAPTTVKEGESGGGGGKKGGLE